MPVFTVLRMLRFSGYYPSCSHCLKRVTVIPASRITQRRYECRVCRLLWQDEAELEYRYCVTAAVQSADHACREVVVFGGSLNPVFGAPATHMQRFIESRILPDHALIGPQSLFHLLVQPLQAVLSGRCFSALLTEPTKHIEPHQDCRKTDRGCDINRHVATNFKLLGNASRNLTVLSLLTNHLSTVEPAHHYQWWCESEKKAHEEEEEAVGERSTGSTDISSNSVLSLVSSSATQHSRNVLLESYNCDLQGATCGDVKSKDNTLQNCSPSVSEATLATTSHTTTSSGPLICCRCSPSFDCMTMCSDVVSSTGAVEGDRIEELLHCESALDERTSVWSQPIISLCNSSQSLDKVALSDNLPDSESFLEEFQCDFEQPSLLVANITPSSLPTMETPHLSTSYGRSKEHGSRSACLLKSRRDKTFLQRDSPHPLASSVCVSNFTPELFSRSPTTLPVSDSHGDNLSPELFSSPSGVADSLVASSSTLVRHEPTPSLGEQVRAVPKRCLLQSLPRSESPWYQNNTHVHTPGGHGRNDGIVHCFSPELFP